MTDIGDKFLLQNYNVKSIDLINSTEVDEGSFGIRISFERNDESTNGILISYHLMCAILVMIASINFLIDPKDSNRAAILVAFVLVLTTVFAVAQNQVTHIFIHKLEITILNLFLNMVDWDNRLHCFDHIHLCLHDFLDFCHDILWFDFIQYEKIQ